MDEDALREGGDVEVDVEEVDDTTTSSPPEVGEPVVLLFEIETVEKKMSDEVVVIDHLEDMEVVVKVNVVGEDEEMIGMDRTYQLQKYDAEVDNT